MVRDRTYNSVLFNYEVQFWVANVVLFTLFADRKI